MAVVIGIAAIVLIAVVLLLASARPNDFAVERSMRIDAPPARIYPHIADFHRWAEWSPFERLDATMTKTHSGAASGPGAVYEWAGNSKVGQGRMEILDATPPSSVTVKLDFLKPFEAHNTAKFTLVPVGTSTDVTWRMFGPSPFVTKVMGVFFNVQKMIGKDFERGLSSLKSVAEAP